MLGRFGPGRLDGPARFFANPQVVGARIARRRLRSAMTEKRIHRRSQAQRVSANRIDPEQQGVAGIVFEAEQGRGEVAHPSLPNA
jgi:hypothetical protein